VKAFDTSPLPIVKNVRHAPSTHTDPKITAPDTRLAPSTATRATVQCT
jgi:hypothetical protein